MPIDIFALPDKKNNPNSSNSASEDGTNTISDIANSPAVNTVLGAGDAIRDLGLGAANLIPGVHTKKYMTPSSEGLAYDVGNVAGNVGAFVGGGEAAEGAGLAEKLAGMLGKSNIAGKVAMNPVVQRLAGAGAFQAASSPDDATNGAGHGIAVQAGFEALSPAGKGIGALYNKVNAKPAYEALLQHLTNGLDAQDLRRGLASKISGVAADAADQVKNKYEEVLNKFGNYKMNQTGSEYSNIGKKYFDDLPVTDDLKNAHADYLKDPTLEKAHFLQSKIGKEMSYYQNLQKTKQATGDDIATLNKLKRPYIKANNDIDSFFNKRNPSYGQKYEDARDFAKKEYYPFFAGKNIRDVVNKDNTNPTSGDINSIFKSPEDFTSRLADKMGNEGKAQILGSHVYGDINKGNPSQVVNRLNAHNLAEKGMSDYLTPEANDLKSNLAKILERREALSKIRPAASSMLGAGAEALTGGGLSHVLMAGAFSPAIASGLSKTGLADAAYNKLASVANKYYRPTSKVMAPLIMQYLKEQGNK